MGNSLPVQTEIPSADFAAAFARHRAELLRHCYRMLGAFADAEDLVQETLLRAWRARNSYADAAPLLHWLMRIATNACLTHLERRAPKRLPQLDGEPSAASTAFEALEAADFVTPAPDAELASGPAERLEAREHIALAFIALMQRLPPVQRAALLLKDVVGWSAEEIAQTLDLTVSSVNSALHRARESAGRTPRKPAADPAPAVLHDYIRCWEERDIEGLVARLREDIVFAMPPYANWFHGRAALRAFLEGSTFAPFWSRGLRAHATRANGLPAVVWYTPHANGFWQPHSIHLMRFDGERAAEAVNFIGAHYLHGFGCPATLALD